MDYKNAGVDIEAGYKSVELMKQHIAKTMRPEVLGGIGGFSGAFSMNVAPFRFISAAAARQVSVANLSFSCISYSSKYLLLYPPAHSCAVKIAPITPISVPKQRISVHNSYYVRQAQDT